MTIRTRVSYCSTVRGSCDDVGGRGGDVYVEQALGRLIKEHG